MIRRVLPFFAASLLALAGCSAESSSSSSDETAEEALGNGATRIAANLEGVDHLVVIGDTLVWSSAHLVASGDPELDQQFAYWQGELWSKGIGASGARRRIGSLSGAVMSTARAASGDELFVVTSGYNGVTKYSVGDGKSWDVYNDYSHFPDDTEDMSSTVHGVAVGDGKVWVTRDGSEVMQMASNGSDVKVFAKSFVRGWVESAEKIVVAGDMVFWSSEKQGERGSTYNLYRAKTSGGSPTKIRSYTKPITSLASDGTRVYIAMQGEIQVAPVDGGAAPRTLVANQPSPDNLVVDELGLFFTEYQTGQVALVKTADLASDAAVTPLKVLAVRAPTSLALSAKDLYVSANSGGTNEKKGEIQRLSRTKLKF
jgi:hypothetical protein